MRQPERLEEILGSVLDRYQDRASRSREPITELNKRASETELRLKRLYDGIEASVADLDDLALNELIAGSEAIRDQVQADVACAAVNPERSGRQSIALQPVSGGSPRWHASASGSTAAVVAAATCGLAQRVQVSDCAAGMIGSQSELLRTLTAAAAIMPATPDICGSVLKWRRG